MNHVRWETLPAPMQDFLRSLTTTPEGSIIEEAGRPTFRVTAYAVPVETPEPEWTEADNQRRVDLINKDLDGRLNEAERQELDSLESRSDQYVNKLAPLPLEPLRKLYDELLTKAASANGLPQA